MSTFEGFSIQQSADDPDLIEFRQGFLLEGKASEETITELEDGDLLIEGWAANFAGLDRESENFVPGSFQEGIKAFLSSTNRPLCFHHKKDHVIGKVLDLREEEGKGLWMSARVDKQVEGSPLFHIYNGIKKRSIAGLSVGGYFRRGLVNGRKMLTGCDFVEISATSTPVHAGTSFAVVAGKALTAEVEPEVLPTPEPDVTVPEPELPVVVDEISEEDLAAVENVIDELSSFFEKIASRRQPKIEADDPSVTTTD